MPVSPSVSLGTYTRRTPDQKFITGALPTDENGWPIPRFSLAMHRPNEGVLVLKDELVSDWNRHNWVARSTDRQRQQPA